MWHMTDMWFTVGVLRLNVFMVGAINTNELLVSMYRY